MIWMIWIACSGGLFTFIGWWILFRIPTCKSESAQRAAVKTSVIIPARNEAHNLPRLLDSLKGEDDGPDEIIVVDDHSEDETAEVVRASGAQLVSAKALPTDWLGKPWACHQGAQAASGDVLIFLDADTFFEPGGFSKLMHGFSNHPGILSINPYHWMKRSYEAFSAFFNIMQMVGMGAFTPRRKTPAGMFGPCLAISRADYDTIGGHQVVKGKLLENYVMASFARQQGIPIHLFAGRGCLNVRLYPNGIRELIRGWTKSFSAGAENTPKGIMRLAILWITGLIIVPIFSLISILLGKDPQTLVGLALYLLFAIQLFIHLRRLGRFPLWASLAFPVPLVFWLVVFFRAGYQMKTGGTTTWKGRNIPTG